MTHHSRPASAMYWKVMLCDARSMPTFSLLMMSVWGPDSDTRAMPRSGRPSLNALQEGRRVCGMQVPSQV